jgi:UPF0755 protein
MTRNVRIVFLAVFVALGFTTSCATQNDEKVMVLIPRGATFRAAAESLAVHGIIRSPRLFSFYASYKERDRTIRYGTYRLAKGTSWDDILSALESGKELVHRIVIPEGWTLWDIVPTLADTLGVPEDSVLAAVRDTTTLRRMGVARNVSDLEGYLFPDTYDFPQGLSARQAVAIMLERFEQVWLDEWDARAEELNMTRHQVVTLASIVEKEVRKGDERPVVSAVYHNRLRIRMALQADPTIQYALKRRRPGRVLYRDLNVQSPYNTYRRTGLPPGPIGAPGAASLKAALYPADVPYKFFVAHPDGHHEFRNTYAEHLKAIQFVRDAARRDSLEKRRKAAESAGAALDSAMRGVAVPDTDPIDLA